MKKHITGNIVLSLIVLLLLSSFSIFSGNQLSIYYYFTIGFFFFIYLSQAIILFNLNVKTAAFLHLYSATTVIKMALSLLALVTYYLVFEPTSDSMQKIYFSLFFLSTYFTYLVVNTRLFFKT